MKINFTKSGSLHTHGKEEIFENLINRLTWIPIPEGGVTISMATAWLIEEALKVLPGGRMTHYCESPEIAPFNLVGIRRQGFKLGPVEIFLVDEGHQTCVIGSRQLITPSQPVVASAAEAISTG